MAESAHHTFAVPETTRYPAPGPGEAVFDFSIRSAILTLVDDSASATEEYAGASAVLAEALGADADARLDLDYREDDFRARAYRDGLPGTNEAQRAAFLAARLADDPDVDEARQARDKAHRARLQAEHDFRVADRAERALRVRLEALTALVHNAGEAGR